MIQICFQIGLYGNLRSKANEKAGEAKRKGGAAGSDEERILLRVSRFCLHNKLATNICPHLPGGWWSRLMQRSKERAKTSFLGWKENVTIIGKLIPTHFREANITHNTHPWIMACIPLRSHVIQERQQANVQKPEKAFSEGWKGKQSDAEYQPDLVAMVDLRYSILLQAWLDAVMITDAMAGGAEKSAENPGNSAAQIHCKQMSLNPRTLKWRQ